MTKQYVSLHVKLFFGGLCAFCRSKCLFPKQSNMSGTWGEIQALKSRQSSMRERLARRKKEREGLVAGITGQSQAATVPVQSTSTAAAAKTDDGFKTPASVAPVSTSAKSPIVSPGLVSSSLSVAENAAKLSENKPLDAQLLSDVESKLQLYLNDVSLDFPIDSKQACSAISKILDTNVPLSAIEDLLQKFAAQQLIEVEEKSGKLTITHADYSKLSAFIGHENEDSNDEPEAKRRKMDGDKSADSKPPRQSFQRQHKQAESNANKAGSLELQNLLSMESAKEKENKKLNDEILELLSQPTAKEQSLVEKFRSQGGAQLKEFCQFGTTEECMKTNGTAKPCDKLHFKKIIHKHTDESLGDCSFLNTCYHMDTCKYVHYTIDYPESRARPKIDVKAAGKQNDGTTTLFPPQWVQCDLRKLDMAVLGKFAVIMADPPWDIHMELPYGTMSDDEMRKLSVPQLQDDGYIFLWVTGRAMELGRECLKLWGYDRIDELIWVKTNQLQRIIRTGRTGHWLNHGKEHCLIGRKGNPKNMNRGLDCDVLVAEVRATSHKPDEVYGMIERLSPGTRKIELFGRPHNVQPNWITLGNQLDGVKLLEPEVVRAFKKRYPNGFSFS